VMQTLAAPDGKSVVQIVRRMETSETSNGYRNHYHYWSFEQQVS
jgi:DNA-directed RNA polymerase subunit H (RpoH/RPB5)